MLGWIFNWKNVGLRYFFPRGKVLPGSVFPGGKYMLQYWWFFSLGNRPPPPPEMVRSKFGLTWLGVFSKNKIIC